MSDNEIKKRGRPSALTPELLNKCQEYLETFRELGHEIPTVEGLALFVDINRDSVYAWLAENRNQDFTDFINRLKSMQASLLISKGLSGAFNPQITKMLLTKHGYSDKLETDHTSSDGSMKPNVIQLVGYDDSEN